MKNKAPAPRPIVLRGAAENNLKHIDVDIPKQKIVVFTGLSGSGKSSVVFDTIAVESQRQLGETFPLYVRNRMPHHERPRADAIENLTPAIVVDQKPPGVNARSTVGTMSDIAPLLRLLFSRAGSPSAGDSTAYSFNDPLGACPVCSGLGQQVRLDVDKLLDVDKSLNEGAICFAPMAVGTWQWQLYVNSGLFDADKKLRDYTEKEWHDLLHGSGVKVPLPNAKMPGGVNYLAYGGLADRFERIYLNRDISTLNKRTQKAVLAVVSEGPCLACGGSRLNEAALETRVNGHSIAQLSDMQVSDLAAVLHAVQHPLGTAIARQAAAGVQGLVDIGLGYLSLSRRTDTLSGGEVQRLKMVRHLGSSLCNMTYILDEPSVGLHPRDIARLAQLLRQLRDKENTVLVVEHDRDIILLADEVIDMGPAAGPGGGQVVYQGDVAGLLCSGTATGQALAHRPVLKPGPRTPTGWASIQNARLHNLQNISVEIPLGVLCAITGVAGSGKSSLAQVFCRRQPRAIVVDQRPIGANARATPATYTGAMDDIRKLFAKESGQPAGLFSANSLGACPVCQGKGEIWPDMAFADPVAITCEACGGSRYSDEALQYRVGGKTIVEVLGLTIGQALKFFTQPGIIRRLATLAQVGLSYMTLGQPLSTLSGGENQRVKLASELHKSGQVVILDEPTTGLHIADTARLLDLLDRLVQQGNTVLVVEHNLDVVAACDWVIDLGPEGGKGGGRVLFCGTPRDLLGVSGSHTAAHLRAAVQGPPAQNEAGPGKTGPGGG